MSDTPPSSLEMLPAELWHDLFEYLDTNELWKAFFALNSTIDTLLKRSKLTFNWTKSHDYHFARRYVVPFSNLRNVRSLTMLDHDDTNFHDVFNEYPLELFTDLRSLSLHIGKWSTRTDIILSQINSLPKLTSLRIEFYCLSKNESVRHLLDLISSRKADDNGSALKKLYLQSCYSTSIIALSTAMEMKGINLRHLSLAIVFLHDFPKAFPYIQQIRSLEVEDFFSKDEFRATLTHEKPLITLPQCTRLTIEQMGFGTIISDLQFLFIHFPSLRQLSIQIHREDDGNDQWELILSKYLPNLLEFKLKMMYCFSDEEFLAKLVKLQSYYQTSFWTDRHTKLASNTNETFAYISVEFK